MIEGLITVIMPVYNSEEYLELAINSILNQTYKNFELLIVDDNSNDNSYEISMNLSKKDKRINVLKNKYKKGISGAINTALEISKGEFITRMDSDDISLPTRLEKQYNFLKNNKEFNACSVNIYFTNKEGKKTSNKLYKKYNAPNEWVFITSNPIPNAPIMYSNEIIKKCNIKYSEKYKTAEDYNFLKDYLLNGGKIALIDESLYEYRQRENNIFNNNIDETLNNSLEIVFDYISNISKISIPFHFKFHTAYIKSFEPNQNLQIEDILEYLKKLSLDFKKYFNWTESEHENALKYIYENLEETIVRKYSLQEKVVQNKNRKQLIIQKLKKILKI